MFAVSALSCHVHDASQSCGSRPNLPLLPIIFPFLIRECTRIECLFALSIVQVHGPSFACLACILLAPSMHRHSLYVRGALFDLGFEGGIHFLLFGFWGGVCLQHCYEPPLVVVFGCQRVLTRGVAADEIRHCKAWHFPHAMELLQRVRSYAASP